MLHFPNEIPAFLKGFEDSRNPVYKILLIYKAIEGKFVHTDHKAILYSFIFTVRPSQKISNTTL